MALNNNAININAGFEVGSQQPLDSRQWLSTAEMKNADANIMPDPYFAINKEDHFLYIFSKSNPISESTGYFTKYTNDGGMTVWKGSEAERDALPEETRADESIIFYTWDTASAEYKNVVSKTVGTVENISEADYQALETKDARTIYTTPGHIRVGEESILSDSLYSSAEPESDITELLRAGGLIVLGPGTYYVSEPVSLPQKTTIKGYGNQQTIIKPATDSSVGNNQSLFSLTHWCRISNLQIIGYGNVYVDENQQDVRKNAITIAGLYCEIDNIWIDQWENAGIGVLVTDTGSQRVYGARITNCTVECCKAGYVLEGEYNFVSQCNARGCTYGLLTIGGSNLITGCHFDKNEVNLRISGNTYFTPGTVYPNNGHSTVSACTFNHAGKLTSENTGWGCYVDHLTVGVNIIGCQWFYGLLEVVDSQGVWFTQCEFGSGTLSTHDNTGLVIFKDCNIHAAPTVQNTDAHRISEGNRLIDGTVWDATVAS